MRSFSRTAFGARLGRSRRTVPAGGAGQARGGIVVTEGPGAARAGEVAAKLATLRRTCDDHGLAAVRLRGVDWFAWATAGGSSVVLLTAETGAGEVLVTAGGAWVLTDDIEVARLAEEEVPEGLSLWAAPWADTAATDEFVAEQVGGGLVASDVPEGGEVPLPDALVAARWSLGDGEVARYRTLGRDAAEAATDVLLAAAPGWSGLQLAGAAAAALWARGIHPALTLVGGERRLPLHRHPTPTAEPLGGVAMLVLCGRRTGLYANLTRFVAFRPLDAEEAARHAATVEVEAAALAASLPGATLGDVFAAVVTAYAEVGHPGAERDHHQGGPCGYLSRDVLARPGAAQVLQERNALAWNPSLPGAKVEDTVLTSSATGLEVLTVDPRWPTGPGPLLPRPAVLDRS